jgi:NAD(P)-dependent dehydrogenase (short-subunit alcohol dehydrogenase family)
MQGVEDRLALVTGAAGDFGSSIAAALAAAGANVVLADRPDAADRLAASAERCARDGGQGRLVDTVTFDVTDAGAVARSVSGIADHHGPIALLVNNAGYQGRFASIVDYPLDDLRRVLDVNVVGVFTVLQAVAAQMVAAGGGAVVNVASMAGASGAVNMPAYSASKAAVAGLTRAAAKDLAPHGIRVNAVSPGFIGPGAMWDRQVAEQARVASTAYGDDPATVAAQMVGSVPLGRFGSVDEVTDSVLFLLSEGAGFITGHDLEISGGGR